MTRPSGEQDQARRAELCKDDGDLIEHICQVADWVARYTHETLVKDRMAEIMQAIRLRNTRTPSPPSEAAQSPETAEPLYLSPAQVADNLEYMAKASSVYDVGSIRRAITFLRNIPLPAPVPVESREAWAAEFSALAERATQENANVNCIRVEDGHGSFSGYALQDNDGKTLLDTLNSDLAVVHTEFEEGDPYSWDEVGHCNLRFIQWCFNHRSEIAAALSWQAAAPASPAAQPEGLTEEERRKVEEIRGHDEVIKRAADLSLAQLERRNLLAIIDHHFPKKD